MNIFNYWRPRHYRTHSADLDLRLSESWPQLKSPRTRVRVIALVRRSPCPPGMPDAFDRAPLR